VTTAKPSSRPRPPIIFVIFGVGGVGKGTIVTRLLRLRDNLWLSRSWTTRRRRSSELTGAYVFVDRDEFMVRTKADGFVEWTEFAGNGQLYGTPTLDAPEGLDVVLEIEIDGAAQVKQRYPEAVLVLIAAPSQQVQAQRLRQRGDDEPSVARRLAVGEEEDRVGRRMADYVVVNDDLGRASQELAGIVDSCRERADGLRPEQATAPVSTDAGKQRRR
jgi:guanylate kinase